MHWLRHHFPLREDRVASRLHYSYHGEDLKNLQRLQKVRERGVCTQRSWLATSDAEVALSGCGRLDSAHGLCEQTSHPNLLPFPFGASFETRCDAADEPKRSVEGAGLVALQRAVRCETCWVELDCCRHAETQVCAEVVPHLGVGHSRCGVPRCPLSAQRTVSEAPLRCQQAGHRQNHQMAPQYSGEQMYPSTPRPGQVVDAHHYETPGRSGHRIDHVPLRPLRGGEHHQVAGGRLAAVAAVAATIAAATAAATAGFGTAACPADFAAVAAVSSCSPNQLSC